MSSLRERKKQWEEDNKKDCPWYLHDQFCCKDLASGRCWDCCATKKERDEIVKRYKRDSGLLAINCPYPKLNKE